MGILFAENTMNMHIVNTDLPVRLDRYLRRIIPSLSQGLIEQHLRKGKIKVNGKKSLSSLRVNNGDRIFIIKQLFSENEESKEQRAEFSTNVIKLAGKFKSEYLLFENEYFMVINKPAKLATQGGSKVNLSIDDVLAYLSFQNKTELKLVHRLDKETSGLLLIAKGYYSANKLASSFENKLIKKVYLAVVAGRMPRSAGKISSLIAKNREGIYDKVEVDPLNGKLAITNYKVIKNLSDTSLIEFMPVTGRTHQLRVHAQMLGCPIIGDSKYGNKINSLPIGNMLLHAERITLSAEIFGKEFVFHAPLPEYFKRFIETKA